MDLSCIVWHSPFLVSPNPYGYRLAQPPLLASRYPYIYLSSIAWRFPLFGVP
jgi:hypothetical protein